MNKKEKELADREVAIYKREQEYANNINELERIKRNWEKVNEARIDWMEQAIALKETEIGNRVKVAKLEAKKEIAQELNDIKDQEILLLKDLLKEAISALQAPSMKNNVNVSN